MNCVESQIHRSSCRLLSQLFTMSHRRPVARCVIRFIRYVDGLRSSRTHCAARVGKLNMDAAPIFCACYVWLKVCYWLLLPRVCLDAVVIFSREHRQPSLCSLVTSLILRYLPKWTDFNVNFQIKKSSGAMLHTNTTRWSIYANPPIPILYSIPILKSWLRFCFLPCPGACLRYDE